MYCQSCGKQIPDESVYCMWCGKPVAGKSTSGEPDDGYPSTDMERWYEDVMRNHVAAHMKDPAGCVWPHYSEQMADGSGRKATILTYIDATNGFGGRSRCSVKISLKKYPEYVGYKMKEPNQAIYVNYR